MKDVEVGGGDAHHMDAAGGKRRETVKGKGSKSKNLVLCLKLKNEDLKIIFFK